MGCCGYFNEVATYVAGLLGIITSTVGCCIAVYHIHLFATSTSDPFVLKTAPHLELILDFLGAAIVIFGAWTVSSTVLLMGNFDKSVIQIKQWAWFTFTIVIGLLFIVLPAILTSVITTDLKKTDVFETMVAETWGGASSFFEFVIFSRYNFFFASFNPAGILTLFANIYLGIFVLRRADEVRLLHEKIMPVNSLPKNLEAGYPEPLGDEKN